MVAAENEDGVIQQAGVLNGLHVSPDHVVVFLFASVLERGLGCESSVVEERAVQSRASAAFGLDARAHKGTAIRALRVSIPLAYTFSSLIPSPHRSPAIMA